MNLNDITRKFVLGEGVMKPTLKDYVVSLTEILQSFSPRTQTDRSRMSVAMETLKEIRRHSRKLEEKVQMLEERISLLEEEEKK